MAFAQLTRLILISCRQGLLSCLRAESAAALVRRAVRRKALAVLLA